MRMLQYTVETYMKLNQNNEKSAVDLKRNFRNLIVNSKIQSKI